MAFRICSSCRKDIQFGSVYQACSVSTCNSKRNPLYFCTVGCWEAHLPGARHRDAWALEKKAPTQAAAQSQPQPKKSSPKATPRPTETLDSGRRRVAVSTPAVKRDAPKEILVVVSKIKNYIRSQSGMNTSDSVMELLSNELRRVCDNAIEISKKNNRVTVLERDMSDALKNN